MPTLTPSDSLDAALLAFQSNLPAISKDNEADTGKYKYNYADLTAITEIVFPMLNELGLSWVTLPTVNDAGKHVLRYELRHSSGEMLVGDFPLPNDTAPQTLGSAITYGRRYALCAVLGLAPKGEDDDGAQASKPAVVAHVPAAQVPPAGWRALLAAVGTVAELQTLYDAQAVHWYTDEVKLAFKARKMQVEAS